jgi:hypothetical protein
MKLADFPWDGGLGGRATGSSSSCLVMAKVLPIQSFELLGDCKYRRPSE